MSVYLDHFALTRQPFTVTPDPRAFYENGRYREAYATLQYGVLERKGFVVLTGEVGTGKTTLLRRLMDALGGTVRFVFLYHTTLTFEEIVDCICAELSLPVEGLGRVSTLTRLNDFLVEESQRGGTVVLLVDEAQHLGPEVLENLRLLSNLETSSDKLLQIVLVGQPELEATLADPSLRQVAQRVALRFRLEPLVPGEIERFIAHRLAVAGRARQDLFTPGAVARIATYSRGIPRVVNILCDAALLLAYAGDAKQVTAALIDEVAADLRIDRPGPGASTTPTGRGRQDDDRGRADGRMGRRRSRSRSRLSPPTMRGAAGIAAVVIAVIGSGALLTLGGPSAGALASIARSVTASLRHPIEAGTVWIERRQRPAIPSPGATPPFGGLADTGQGDEASAVRERARGTASAEPTELPRTDTTAAAGSARLGTTTGALTNGETNSSAALAREAAGAEPHRLTPARPPDNRRAVLGARAPNPQIIVVPPGGTVSAIAAAHYGSADPAILDLISAANRHVENLDRIVPGERITLPALTLDAFSRWQSDGSYRLMLGSFPAAADAERLAQSVRRRGYRAGVTARRVTPALTLYRVEIGRLRGRDAVRDAWAAATREGWLMNHVGDPR